MKKYKLLIVVAVFTVASSASYSYSYNSNYFESDQNNEPIVAEIHPALIYVGSVVGAWLIGKVLDAGWEWFTQNEFDEMCDRYYELKYEQDLEELKGVCE